MSGLIPHLGNRFPWLKKEKKKKKRNRKRKETKTRTVRLSIAELDKDDCISLTQTQMFQWLKTGGA